MTKGDWIVIGGLLLLGSGVYLWLGLPGVLICGGILAIIIGMAVN